MASKYQQSKDNYLKEKVDTFVIRVPKGEKALIKEYASKQGKSLNAYVVDLIHADMGTKLNDGAHIVRATDTDSAVMADNSNITADDLHDIQQIIEREKKIK